MDTHKKAIEKKKFIYTRIMSLNGRAYESVEKIMQRIKHRYINRSEKFIDVVIPLPRDADRFVFMRALGAIAKDNREEVRTRITRYLNGADASLSLRRDSASALYYAIGYMINEGLVPKIGRKELRAAFKSFMPHVRLWVIKTIKNDTKVVAKAMESKISKSLRWRLENPLPTYVYALCIVSIADRELTSIQNFLKSFVPSSSDISGLSENLADIRFEFS